MYNNEDCANDRGYRCLMNISIDIELRDIVKLGVIEVDSVRVEEGSIELWREIDALCEKIGMEHQNKAWTEIPGVSETRELYRKCRIDPTKTRPSSEALLRRTLQRKGLYRINNLVDVCNWCSLEFQLPIGLYDLDRIEGNVICRFGTEGEFFPGIRKDDVHVGGRVCMADDGGAFGSPTSDSARTMIKKSTKRAAMILFALKQAADPLLITYLGTAEGRIHDFCKGSSFNKYLCSV